MLFTQGFLEALKRDLEAARYGAHRAWKQYDAADPENRLVADELERRWNQALQHVEELTERIDEYRAGDAHIPDVGVEDFEDLAADLEALWHSPDTDVRLKKRIVRTLINEVIADVDAKAGEIILVVHWKGGMHTELRVPRRRRGQSSQHTSKEIVRAVRMLVRVCSDDMIAALLNRNGLLTGRGNRWSRERVASLRSKSKIPCYNSDKHSSKGWMNLTQAAQWLGISPITLRLAVERGKIKADHPLSGGPWVFRCQELETKAAAELVERTHRRNGRTEISNSGQRNIDFSSA